jgi:hypothetical protein
MSFLENIKMLTTCTSPVVTDLISRKCARREGIVTVLIAPGTWSAFRFIERLRFTGLSFLLVSCSVLGFPGVFRPEMGHPTRLHERNHLAVSVVMLIEDGKLMIRVPTPMAEDTTNASGRELIADGRSC